MQKIHFRIKRRGSFRWKEGRKEKEAPLGWKAALYVYKKAFIIKAKNKFDVSFVREAAATLAAAATSAAVAFAAASSEKMMDEGYPNRVMVPSVGRFLLLLFQLSSFGTPRERERAQGNEASAIIQEQARRSIQGYTTYYTSTKYAKKLNTNE